MFSGLAALLIAAVVLVAAHRYATGPGRHVVARFERYRPHAPMADWTAPAAKSPAPRHRALGVLRRRSACVVRDRSGMRPTLP